MKIINQKTIKSLAVMALLAQGTLYSCAQEITLKEALKDKFLIGVAVDTLQASDRDVEGAALIRKQFSSVVAENCMKSEVIHPAENVYDFEDADVFIDFAEKNNQAIIGHTLIWHSQLAPWFCVDENGNNVSPDVLKKRMKDHITTIMHRYKGRIHGWDVVNEAINDDGSYRNSQFYQILGEEYIPLAFQYAYEADPNVELYYNDYSMAHAGRRETVVRLVNTLKQRGIRIDAVGMQGHFQMDFPLIENFEKSLLAFAATGVKVMITELDMTILPPPQYDMGADVSASFEYKEEMNPYPNGLPAEVDEAWTNRMADFFRLFIKHHKHITRVNVWGLTDQNTWRNDWPIKGRTDYPVLFDRQHRPKPVVDLIIKEATKK